MSRQALPAEGLGVTLHTPGPMQKGLPSLPALLFKLLEAELTFRAFPGVVDAIQRNSVLTCAVGGGLKCRLQGPLNFLEGTVAGMGLWLWENPAGAARKDADGPYYLATFICPVPHPQICTDTNIMHIVVHHICSNHMHTYRVPMPTDTPQHMGIQLTS